MWWKRYRIILLAYTAALGLGVREVLVTRDKDPFGWLSPEGQDLMGVLTQVNPTDPETDFLEGMRALSAGDAEEYFRRMDQAFAANIKHNEMFLRSYAQSLLDNGADWAQVNRAVNRWRQNFPFSGEALSLYLPQDRRYDPDLGPAGDPPRPGWRGGTVAGPDPLPPRPRRGHAGRPRGVGVGDAPLSCLKPARGDPVGSLLQESSLKRRPGGGFRPAGSAVRMITPSRTEA